MLAIGPTILVLGPALVLTLVLVLVLVLFFFLWFWPHEWSWSRWTSLACLLVPLHLSWMWSGLLHDPQLLTDFRKFLRTPSRPLLEHFKTTSGPFQDFSFRRSSGLLQDSFRTLSRLLQDLLKFFFRVPQLSQRLDAALSASISVFSPDLFCLCTKTAFLSLYLKLCIYIEIIYSWQIKHLGFFLLCFFLNALGDFPPSYACSTATISADCGDRTSFYLVSMVDNSRHWEVFTPQHNVFDMWFWGWKHQTVWRLFFFQCPTRITKQ